MTFPFDPTTYLAAAAVVAGAYVVFGISAFGAALFTVPALSYLRPLDFVLTVCVLLDVTAAWTLGARFSREADRRELAWLGSFSLAGAVAGVTLLVLLPHRITLAGCGLFLAGYGIYTIRGGSATARLSQRWAPVFGFVGGAMGTMFGVAAPPYAIYLTRRIADKLNLRATLSAMVLISTSIRTAVFVASGLMTGERFVAFLVLAPFMFLGLRTGVHIQGRISREALVRVISMLLALIGTSLRLRALFRA
jgi:uncharacterized membrane protein YfcA